MVEHIERFKIRRSSELQHYINQIVSWLDLNNKKRIGILTFDKGKYWVPESGGVNATTVKIQLILTIL